MLPFPVSVLNWYQLRSQYGNHQNKSWLCHHFASSCNCLLGPLSLRSQLHQNTVSSELLKMLSLYHQKLYFELVDCQPWYFSKQNYLQWYSFLLLCAKQNATITQNNKNIDSSVAGVHFIHNSVNIHNTISLNDWLLSKTFLSDWNCINFFPKRIKHSYIKISEFEKKFLYQCNQLLIFQRYQITLVCVHFFLIKQSIRLFNFDV